MPGESNLSGLLVQLGYDTPASAEGALAELSPDDRTLLEQYGGLLGNAIQHGLIDPATDLAVGTADLFYPGMEETIDTAARGEYQKALDLLQSNKTMKEDAALAASLGPAAPLGFVVGPVGRAMRTIPRSALETLKGQF